MTAATTWIDLVWCDLLGRPRTVRVAAAALRERHTVPVALVTAGFGGPGAGEGDLLLVPDESSAVSFPYEPGVAVMMADLHELWGEPSPLCSRGALKRVLGQAHEWGMHLQAAAELEFFLIDPVTDQPLYPEIANYSVTKGSELEPVMAGVRNDLAAMGIPIEASNPEYSGGQVEVNIRYGDALRAADRAVLLRMMIRLLARRVGLDATFMAKPWTDQAGNGMHVHQSLWRQGRNAFFDSGQLSEIGRHYIGGLLEHMREFAIFGCATPNAYHRRSDYSFAPTVICWGEDNRTLAVRSIVGGEGATRVEQRDASADCNIHLTFAGQFAAGLDGVARRREPAERVSGNAYERRDLPRLPSTFVEAFDLIERSDAAKRLLDPQTVTAYLNVLRDERTVVLASSSDWERARYLRTG